MSGSEAVAQDAEGRAERPDRPRRAPSGPHRQRDAARSRERLLGAALDEFSARGFAGARVSAIAARAGLNQQLISYYFGGKEGLFQALAQRWLDQEQTLAAPGASLDDLVIAYLHAVFDDPRMARLLLWMGLTDDPDRAGSDPPMDAPDARDLDGLDDLRRRQASGELPGDLDPGLFQVAFMGATLAPLALPHVVRRLTGLAVDDPSFQAQYTQQLRLIVRHLTGLPPAPPS